MTRTSHSWRQPETKAVKHIVGPQIGLMAALVCMFGLFVLPAAGDQKGASPATISVVIRSRGMEPPSVTVAAGDVYIVTHNATTARQLQLSLAVENGKSLRVVTLPFSKDTSYERYTVSVRATHLFPRRRS